MTDSAESLKPTAEAVSECSFATWYTRFRRYTFASKVVPLSTEFAEFLLADGIVIESGRQTSKSAWSDDSDSESEESNKYPVKFPMIEEQVNTAIKQLGGSVFPKLNWSAPKDAAWIAPTRNLNCISFADILLLLKSSDVIVHDLQHAYDDCCSPPTDKVSPVLVLRQWRTINPAHEFRCFVRENQLIAISQRDMAHYAFLKPVKNKILNAIRYFYINIVKDKFEQSNFVFDIYFDKLEPEATMLIIDFAPFGGSTNPLLFSWEELTAMDVATGVTVVRLMPAEAGQINTGTGLLNQFPLEIVDLAYGESVPDFNQLAQEARNNPTIEDD
ncbi:hypothetical protein BDF19DRAFT_422518 [Syncephalis fuscata]|nr:hypothetical protein BDF19DRAFT_422518 [Syncephalis fuscata]